MSDLITVSNGIQTLKIHPSTLKAHERAGWKVVPAKAEPVEKAEKPEKPEKAEKEPKAEKTEKA